MQVMSIILKSALINILGEITIGRSKSYPCGWIETDDLIKIVNIINSGKYDQFGNMVSNDDQK